MPEVVSVIEKGVPMRYKLLLLSENPSESDSLRQALQHMKFDVLHMDIREFEKLGVPLCAIIILHIEPLRMEDMLRRLRHRNQSWKLLALLPFYVKGWEIRLVDAGADDMLILPVSQGRLEVTLHNLLKLYVLERAATAYG
jgi:DNA-binding response OmpR family regulator